MDGFDLLLSDQATGLQGLPHLDFDELWKTLNVGDPGVGGGLTGETDWAAWS